MKALPVIVVILLLTVPVGAGAPTGSVSDLSGESATVTTAASSPQMTPASDRPDLTGQAGESAPPPQLENRSAARVLTVPSAQLAQTNLDRQHGDLASAISADVSRVNNRLSSVAVREQIRSAPDSDEREIRTLDAVTQIEQAEISLNRRQRDAITAHSQGELTDRELFAEMGTIALRANALRDRLNTLRPFTEEYGLETRRLALEFRLQTYDGPVRSHAQRVVRGETGLQAFYAETGGESMTLAALVGDQYVRESFRGDRWDRSGTTFESLREAENATQEAYPVTWASQTDRESTGAGTVYRVGITHPRGSLTTFVGTGSERVFKEHQRLDLAELTPDTTRTVIEEGLQATVNRSYRGGPARVTIRDSETGDPIEGVVVTVGIGAESTAVGQTDADGMVWTLEPGQTYRIQGVADGPSVVRVDEITPTKPSPTAD